MTSIYIVRADSIFRVKLKSDSTSDFALCIDALKSYIGVPLRSYKPASRAWEVDADAHDELRAWLAYARSTFNAQVQWIGGEADTDPEAEWTPPKRARPKSVDPYTALWLLPGAPPEVIKAAYRALALMNHPDHGGDTAAMQRINAAFKLLATA